MPLGRLNDRTLQANQIQVKIECTNNNITFTGLPPSAAQTINFDGNAINRIKANFDLLYQKILNGENISIGDPPSGHNNAEIQAYNAEKQQFETFVRTINTAIGLNKRLIIEAKNRTRFQHAPLTVPDWITNPQLEDNQRLPINVRSVRFQNAAPGTPIGAIKDKLYSLFNNYSLIGPRSRVTIINSAMLALWDTSRFTTDAELRAFVQDIINQLTNTPGGEQSSIRTSLVDMIGAAGELREPPGPLASVTHLMSPDQSRFAETNGLIDPITLSVLKKPVMILPSGKIYDESSINDLRASGRPFVCPETRLPICDIIPATVKQLQVDAFREAIMRGTAANTVAAPVGTADPKFSSFNATSGTPEFNRLEDGRVAWVRYRRNPADNNVQYLEMHRLGQQPVYLKETRGPRGIIKREIVQQASVPATYVGVGNWLSVDLNFYNSRNQAYEFRQQARMPEILAHNNMPGFDQLSANNVAWSRVARRPGSEVRYFEFYHHNGDIRLIKFTPQSGGRPPQSEFVENRPNEFIWEGNWMPVTEENFNRLPRDPNPHRPREEAPPPPPPPADPHVNNLIVQLLTNHRYIRENAPAPGVALDSLSYSYENDGSLVITSFRERANDGEYDRALQQLGLQQNTHFRISNNKTITINPEGLIILTTATANSASLAKALAIAESTRILNGNQDNLKDVLIRDIIAGNNQAFGVIQEGEFYYLHPKVRPDIYDQTKFNQLLNIINAKFTPLLPQGTAALAINTSLNTGESAHVSAIQIPRAIFEQQIRARYGVPVQQNGGPNVQNPRPNAEPIRLPEAEIQAINKIYNDIQYRPVATQNQQNILQYESAADTNKRITVIPGVSVQGTSGTYTEQELRAMINSARRAGLPSPLKLSNDNQEQLNLMKQAALAEGLVENRDFIANLRQPAPAVPNPPPLEQEQRRGPAPG